MNIALVAHDGRKQELIEWCKYNYNELSKHNLYATGTTGRLIKEIEIDKPIIIETDNSDIIQYNKPFANKVTCLLSGPLGGDQRLGAMISEGDIDCLIFFCDNLITQGHQQDVGALSRLASLYNIPFATNRTTADMLLTSSLWNNKDYERIVPRCISDYTDRQLNL